jgi:hypothetical protein
VVVVFTPGPVCCVEEFLKDFVTGGGGGGWDGGGGLGDDFFTGATAANTGVLVRSATFGLGFSFAVYFS